jgi:hypothetical protein
MLGWAGDAHHLPHNFDGNVRNPKGPVGSHFTLETLSIETQAIPQVAS